MMSGRVWLVRYEVEAAEMVCADLERFYDDGARGAIVTCGSTGAIWRARLTDQKRGEDGKRVIEVELWPLDAHTVNPSVDIGTLIRPSVAVA